jgi:hypothetical protein
MKTIAVMNMAFLPAIFFAALFSMPSLQWDQPTIVHSNFWVYWAFTLPTTVIVFLVWFFTTGARGSTEALLQSGNHPRAGPIEGAAKAATVFVDV